VNSDFEASTSPTGVIPLDGGLVPVALEVVNIDTFSSWLASTSGVKVGVTASGTGSFCPKLPCPVDDTDGD